MFATVLKGMMIGFAFIAPIGMQNLYVFNNAMNHKMRRALLYVMFVWVADASFSLSAFFGMGALIATTDWLKLAVMLVGSLLVMWIGFGILRGANSVQLNQAENQMTPAKAFATAFVVSWANPQALVDGSLMLGALRGTLADAQVWPFIIGVLIASAIWFNGITITMNILKERLPKRVLVWVNIVSAVIVMAYGVYLFYEAIVMIMHW
jgi:L-lysine exporter family protein LysE/ArgO